MVVGFYQKDIVTNTVRMIDYIEGEGSDGMPEMIGKVLKKPYNYGSHIAPHDIEATDIGTGKTRMETSRTLGINFKIAPDQSIEDGINAVSVWLDRLHVDKTNCKKWIRSMKNYGREWDEKRGMYKEVPLHDWASHGADVSRYAALSEKFMVNSNQYINRPFYDKTVDIWNGGDKQLPTNSTSW